MTFQNMIMKQNFLVKTISSFLLFIAILLLSPTSSVAQLKLSVLAGVNNSKISIGNYNVAYQLLLFRFFRFKSNEVRIFFFWRTKSGERIDE